MKKRVVTLLFATMAVGTIMACGNSASNEETVPATAAVVESSSESVEEESTTEMGEETISEKETVKEEPISEEPQENVQSNTYTDKADDKTEILNTPQTMLSNTEVSAENVIHNDALEPVADGGNINEVIPVSDVAELPSYSFTNMNVTMYAKSGVNVRDLPGTEGTKVGRLAEGQEVIVTGQCKESSWYRILLNDSEVYVSDSYIVSEMPVTNQADTPRAVTAEVHGATPVVAETSETVADSGAMPDFISYLNQQRAAAGLSAVTWDDGLAAIASTRANEIVTDFNHGGSWSGMENIYKGCSGKSGDVFLAWNESTGHRIAMFDEQADTAACAFVKSGEFYYVVYLYNTKPYTQEEMNQKVDQGLADGSLTQTEDYNGLSVTFTTEGSEVVTDEGTIQSIMDAINQYKGQ